MRATEFTSWLQREFGLGHGHIQATWMCFRTILGILKIWNNSIKPSIPSVTIQAEPSRVWEVFTNPMLTRQLGGEYVTNWQVGGDFGFKMNGQMVTKGTITAITPREYLEHTLIDPQGNITSKISYCLKAKDGGTTLLQGKEQFKHAVSKQEYVDGEAGWQEALAAVKRIAEEN